MACCNTLPPPLLPPLPETLLSRNEAWSSAVTAQDENFFPVLAAKQSPKILWIGCVDSRVPETVITASRPGDILTHRNIANLFIPGDSSAESVLSFAVHRLEVDHVIICGHTSCGGIISAHAAVFPRSETPSDELQKHYADEMIRCPEECADHLTQWLQPIVDFVNDNRDEFDPDAEGATDPIACLIEANVKQQVENVSNSVVFQPDGSESRNVDIHGWVYDLKSGKIRDLNVTKKREVSRLLES